MKCIFRLCLVSLSLLLIVAGCSKKPVANSTTPDAVPADAPAAVQTATPSRPSMANESQATVDARIAAAKSALQSKDYQKVNAALFPPVNRQAPVPMTGPELMSINDAKAAYLNQLSAAAAKGDASAKAALEMIQRQQNR